MFGKKKYEIEINCISLEEMREHTREMRREMDSKFVSCLMATGLTRAESMREVRIWNAERDW